MDRYLQARTTTTTPAPVRDGLTDHPHAAVLLTGGPMHGQAFTVTDWRTTVASARGLTARDGRPRHPTRYGPGPHPDTLPTALDTWHTTVLHWT